VSCFIGARQKYRSNVTLLYEVIIITRVQDEFLLLNRLILCPCEEKLCGLSSAVFLTVNATRLKFESVWHNENHFLCSVQQENKDCRNAGSE
jgi:hypothetical protein